MAILELIERIRSGQDVKRSEEELYSLVSEALLRRLREKIPARLNCRLDAEDVLNEAFLRALGALKTFRPSKEDSFLAWVYQIGKNLIADHNKRRSVMAVHFATEEGQKGPRESQIVPRHPRRVESELVRRDWIESILCQLQEKEAEVIRLRSLHGYSFEEIAKSWNKTPGAVQRFYSRAWHRFCTLAQLKPMGGTDLAN